MMTGREAQLTKQCANLDEMIARETDPKKQERLAHWRVQVQIALRGGSPVEFVLVEYHARRPGELETYCGLKIPQWAVDIRSSLVKHEDPKKCRPLCERCEILVGHHWVEEKEETQYRCRRCHAVSDKPYPGRVQQCPVAPQRAIMPEGSEDGVHQPSAPRPRKQEPEFKELQEKALALFTDKEMTVTWAQFRKQVSQNPNLLGVVVRKLLNDGQLVEVQKMTYARGE